MSTNERGPHDGDRARVGETTSSVALNHLGFVVLRSSPDGEARYFEVPAPQPCAIEAVLRERHGAQLTRDGLWWLAFPDTWGPNLLDDFECANPGLILIDEYAYDLNEVFDSGNHLGVPITGDHSGAIEDYVRWCLAAGLHPDRVEELTDWRGDDCQPRPWGMCRNSPCPHDALCPPWDVTCAEMAALFPHRLRAGRSMRHDGVIPAGGSRDYPRPLPHGATIAAAELPGHRLREALARATHYALGVGQAAVVVGASDGEFVICTAGCCVRARGVFVVVPDEIETDTAPRPGQSPLWWWASTERLTDRRGCRVHTSVLRVKS